ncbi:hypothetical protein [Deinococcus sp. 23YEL01]|uniref:hypothetical protein n=1 Tax=Deinococcus sp. 23YEL01 TaxID=2745871 RepID=UPI001E365F1F|nr:hypothetical protein [Deinococcus sp. 23YEL01]MCD0168039.1 hypothetical protein [Deinococcus sp. 23YEL01]
MPQPLKDLPALPVILTILNAAAAAQKPQLKANTLARYAGMLRAAGLIERSPGNGRYVLTPQGATIHPKMQRLNADLTRLSSEASILLSPLLLEGRA